MDGPDLALNIVAEGDRIAKEKDGKALTPAEADKVKAANFIRQIAPYLFETTDDEHTLPDRR